MAETTKLVRFHKLGGSEVLNVEQVPVPQPGKGEVRLRVDAVSLNRAESLFRAGYYLYQPKFPASVGYEAAGIIEALGEGVTKFKVGDRVSVISDFSLNDYGTSGERVLIAEHSLIKHPENITQEQASAVWLAYLTSYFALFDVVQLKKDDFIVVTASSSSSGIAAIQLAKIVGAKVIATSRTSAKKQAILDLGADYFIATKEEDLEKRIAEITQGKGAKVIYDPVAGAQVAALLRSASVGGTVILYGLMQLEKFELSGLEVLPGGKTIRGYLVFEFTGNSEYPRNEEAIQRATKFINQHLADGTLKPVIDKVFEGIDQYAAAHKYLDDADLLAR